MGRGYSCKGLARYGLAIYPDGIAFIPRLYRERVKTHSNLRRQINIVKSFCEVMAGCRQRTKFITR